MSSNIFCYKKFNLYCSGDGFTLAEVLITLGIIGVVAAITLPNLITNYKAKQLRTQFTKTYSVLAQGFKLMVQDDVSIDLSSYAPGTRHKTLVKYLTNATICSGNVSGNAYDSPLGCHVFKGNGAMDGYKYLNANGDFKDGAYNDGQLMLADGTLIFFDDCPARENWKGCMVTVDINGIKKPNRLGYDFFAFEVVDGMLYPMGDLHTTYANRADCDFSKANQLGTTCAKNAKDDSDYFKKVVKLKLK